jgi:putative pyruvate formate lyase activating enzyme
MLAAAVFFHLMGVFREMLPCRIRLHGVRLYTCRSGFVSGSVSSEPGGDVLRDKALIARRTLQICTVCEVRCGVNRSAGEVGPCGLNGESYVYQRRLSLAEEVELIPAYLVYLSGCNLRCRFCVQGPKCFNPQAGELVEPGDIAADMERAVARGARTVTFIGGEPALHPHLILDVAARFSRPMPLVLKTNLYLTPFTLELLRGAIQLYVVDFKFGDDGCGKLLAGCERYVDVLRRNLLYLQSHREQLLIRHLLMPGHLRCCFEPVARWVAAHLPGVVFRVMTGYVPAWRAERDAVLGRTCRAKEIKEAEDLVRGLRLRTQGEFNFD